MKKLDVLIISHEFPPQIGGVGSMAKYLFEILINQKNINVNLITRKHKSITELTNITRISYIPKLFFLPYYFHLKKIDLDKYNYIILNGFPSTIIGSLCIPRSLWAKCIVYIHGTELENFNSKNELIKRSFYKNYFSILRKSKYVVFCSEFLMNKFTKKNIYGNFICIPNFIDHKKFYKKYQTGYEDKILLSVGRIIKEKGYSLMLDDFKELRDKKFNYKWWIIGDGPYKQELQKKIKEFNLSDDIIFLGNVPNEKLINYYSKASIYWSYSQFESFGLTFLEANACGIPFLAKDIEGIKHFRIDNVNSYYRENYKLLSDFITYYESRKKVDIDEIIKSSLRFNKDNFQKKWLNLLSK
ncbi:glycosyltransferase family 4 protein [Bacillus sp. AFS041924]|uniref:glycosyltransferase family 4 protein n=1 Tax=Bacillus sp. AFS041924 TaxID=2033503 RepID=UPI000BFBFA31|nr:glycosyltransferase family 4 protein [Bacillus sp. AFS041924]PGS56023.1 hypothetical protein COC46_01960 [Bacillus sp. AFS041924]